MRARTMVGAMQLSILLTALSSPVAAAAEIEAVCPEGAVVRVLVIKGIVLRKETALKNGARTELRNPLVVPVMAHGSGAIVSRDGLILTSRHVVEGATGIAIWPPGGRNPIPAELVYSEPGQDLTSDFAFLKVRGEFSEVIALPGKARTLAKGRDLAAQGYPLAAREERPVYRKGSVQRLSNRRGTVEITATLDHGMSGGPVCDAGGLVGISAAVEGRGGNEIVALGPVLAAYAKEVSRRRMVEDADRRLASEERAAYRRYAEGAARLMLNAPEPGAPTAVWDGWLSGHLRADSGEPHWKVFEKIDSPEARLVFAAFLWNTGITLMWSRNCDDLDCAEQVERNLVIAAHGLVIDAVQHKPSLRHEGGPAVQFFIEIENRIRAELKAAPPSAGVSAGAGPAGGTGSERDQAACRDRVDNDADGFVDCADQDCHGFCGQAPEEGDGLCRDGLDNDLDGLRDCADPGCAPFCRRPELDGRPYGEFGDWMHQYVLYGGVMFPGPFGESTEPVSWGVGFLYQVRPYGFNLLRWLSIDLVIGFDALLHSWPDYNQVGSYWGTGSSKHPEGITFAFSFEPTLRLCIGPGVGLVLEVFYPLTLMLTDPFSFGYKNWGLRAGVFFDGGTAFGVGMTTYVPDDERHGLWALFLTSHF